MSSARFHSVGISPEGTMVWDLTAVGQLSPLPGQREAAAHRAGKGLFADPH